MRPTFVNLLLAITCVILAYPALCFGIDSTRVIELDTVVVRASRTGSAAGRSSSPVTVLETETLHDGPSLTVDKTLEQVAGFSLFRRSDSRSSHPTAQGVSLRGVGASGSSRSLVLLDGIPLNDPFGGWVRWAQVRTERVERVEILRGGGSQLWGNYALSGIINILTAEPSGRNVSLSAGAGSLKTGQADFSAAERMGESLSLALEGGWTSSKGYIPVRGDQRGLIDTDAGFSSRSLGLVFGKRFANGRRLSLRGGWYEDERDNGTRLTRNATRTGYAGAGLSLVQGRAGLFEIRTFGQAGHFESVFSSQSARPRGRDPCPEPARCAGAGVGSEPGMDRP